MIGNDLAIGAERGSTHRGKSHGDDTEMMNGQAGILGPSLTLSPSYTAQTRCPRPTADSSNKGFAAAISHPETSFSPCPGGRSTFNRLTVLLGAHQVTSESIFEHWISPNDGLMRALCPTQPRGQSHATCNAN